MKQIGDIRDYAIYGLTAAAVFLGWEIIKAPIMERSPPAIALRIAPSSPQVLQRAGEAEFQAGRVDNARYLAEASLREAPFNVRALRVLGLSLAREGNVARADELLTLAGNWSLRDDPAHAWLVERRLRQGSYDSAFAHADTLARRWKDGAGNIFNLFTTAVLLDQRSLPALAKAVSRRPPWRAAYIQYLVDRPDADPVLLALGLTLGKTEGRLSNGELSLIYQTWYGEGRFDAIRALRAGVGRPGRLDDVQNGDFSVPAEEAVFPFGWRVEPQSGIAAAVMDDDIRTDDLALRVDYDGYANGVVAEQILMLPIGARELAGQERVEASPRDSRLRWRLVCVESGTIAGSLDVSSAGAGDARWTSFRMPFVVPAQGCAVQRLRLETVGGDRRATTIAWFDKLQVQRSQRGRPNG